MPAVSTGKVLMTGATGFLGSWTLKAFLEAGFAVRAAVRAKGKTAHLRKLFGEYGDNLEFVVIPDMAKEGAFDEATVGVVAVVHIASPVTLTADHPDELIIPAVQSTLGILRSASNVPSVQRVLYLSSNTTIIDRSVTEQRVYDEDDWNEHDPTAVKTQGRAMSQHAKYRASKTLAERAAWDFWRENKAKGAIGWDLVSINPPWILGPVIHEFDGTPDGLNASCKIFYDAIVEGQFPTVDKSFVDVRDVAQATLLGITKPSAGGERFITSAGPFWFEDFLMTAYKISGGKTHPLSESYNPDAPPMATMNATKSKEVLGMEYRPKEETVKDILQDYEGRGWL